MFSENFADVGEEAWKQRVGSNKYKYNTLFFQKNVFLTTPVCYTLPMTTLENHSKNILFVHFYNKFGDKCKAYDELNRFIIIYLKLFIFIRFYFKLFYWE